MRLYMMSLLPMLLMSMGLQGQKSVTVYNLGPNDIILDANLIRGQFGYSQINVSSVHDSINGRMAKLGQVKCEFRLVSSAMDKYMNFVVHEALYTDMSMGKMTRPHVDNQAGGETGEGSFAFTFNWGYDFFTGYRNKYWGLLAGIRPQWSMVSMGDFSSEATQGGLGVFSFSYPLALRAEWRPFSHFEYRIIATAWHSMIGGLPWSGARLEIPTFPRSRFWIFAEINTYSYQYLYLSTDPYSAKGTTILNLGIRFGSIF